MFNGLSCTQSQKLCSGSCVLVFVSVIILAVWVSWNQVHFLSTMPPTVCAHSYSYSCTHSSLDTLEKCGFSAPPLPRPSASSSLPSFFSLSCGYFQCGCFGGSCSRVRTTFVFLFPSLGRAYWVPVLVVIIMGTLLIVCLLLVYYNQILLTKMLLNFNL